MSDATLKSFFDHQAGLGLSPESLFGEAGSGFMRMRIAAPKQVISEALQRVNIALLNSG